MIYTVFKLIGILGVLLISLGIVYKKRKMQDELYIFGGICLTVYSVFIGDAIFVVLQLIFIAAAVYDLKRKKVLKKWFK